MFDAVTHMVTQYFFLDAPQRRPDRGNLRDDVDTIAILFDHAGNAPHLSFDALEPF